MWKGGCAVILNAADIMTKKVLTVHPQDQVHRVAKLLSDRGISAAPVCDDDGRPVGMISEGDLLKPFRTEHALKRSWWLNVLAEGVDLAPEFVDYLRMDHRTASDLMTTPVVTATEDATVPELANLMAEHRIKRVPIVRGGKLVGVVSRADVVRALAREPDKVLESI